MRTLNLNHDDNKNFIYFSCTGICQEEQIQSLHNFEMVFVSKIHLLHSHILCDLRRNLEERIASR